MKPCKVYNATWTYLTLPFVCQVTSNENVVFDVPGIEKSPNNITIKSIFPQYTPDISWNVKQNSAIELNLKYFFFIW